MPLKIESGTYTVNRRPTSSDTTSSNGKNRLSKFTLWRHWRRSVHEDRGSSEERSSSQQQQQQEEPPLPPSRTTRRSRPHSLAVQPLNYQRLDPDQLPPPPSPSQVLENRQPEAPASAQAAGTVRQPNMTSQESIGSCSLDVDKSASDRSEVNAGSLSEKTLHSLNLSTCNGEPTIRVTEPPPAPESNGHESHEPHSGEDGSDGAGEQQLTAKKPSYLGLACSINGYSGITRYDSKLREGFRSRDSSPGSRLIHRDTSPAGFRSNETLNVPTSAGNQQPTKSQSISPLAMDRQHNGFANGGVKHKIDNYHESSRVIGSCQGYSEVDRGTPAGHAAALEQLSPIRASSPNKRDSPVGMRIAAYNQQNKSYSSMSSSSPKSFSVNVSHASYSETSILNGSSDHEGGFNSSASSEKSFIQQRVERLYGPGALAQGFFFKRSSKHDFSHDSSANKSSSSSNNNNNNNNSSVHETSVEESLKNLPVLRHLRPEFRAQLPVVSPRRPTDGTEQIIKPLKRISLSTGKNDAKEIKASPIKQESNNATSDVKMTASVTSLTDQQPAAPKVVLPVLEPSASLTNIPKQGAETPKKVQEKDGHYFMSVLDKERKRLIVLAEGAEAELSGSGASALPEEAAGKLRSAAGKARLLASQKMKQFEGLCQKNINQVPGEEFPTTSEDLAGFWDMVMLQVVQVNDLFEQLDRSRKSQWQEVAPEQKPTPATPHNGSAIKRRQTPASKAKSAANAEAARKAREAREQTRRQLLEERRRAMRSSAGKPNNSVEMFLPET
ncbi:disks large-associated protein 4 isoform X2 [Nasonia vitripennis]|uniref:Disks large-associated protein 4 n=1 Tax=Nasonia vitripennis TaxID=7425 RepID=A0A7M7H6W5_NASVI|nr:disks large-associated protein 4 isoform X2 [Nasonia vitripennis]